MPRILEAGGRRIPFLRWSLIRMLLGMRKLTTDWQVGDGREEALGAHVAANAPAGDLDAAIDAIDRFGYEQSFLINVGDEKGALLDRAVEATAPKLLLELGTYVGYSALRTARAMPDGARLDKNAYLPDLETIFERGWLHPGSRIVGDNIKFPGAPEFRAYLNERDGGEWRVTEHETTPSTRR